MSMLYCAVPGCESTTKTTKYTFHRFPRDVIRRARWILAVRCPVRSLNGRSRVCGRHFDKSMFTRPARGVELVKHAVPTLYLPPKTRPATEPAKEEYTYTYDTPFERESSVEQESNETDEIHSVVTNRIKKSVKTDLSGDVAACRGCLETKGQLRDIRDIGLEDIFLELSGEECLLIGLPRHLCVFCASQLSRCAAFRARCRQSSALLQTLVDFSTKPLTINDIKTIDRQKHKLTHGFTPKIVCHFQTDPYVNMLCDETREDEIHALAPDQSDTESKITQDYTEIEYLESDDDENIETHSNVHLVIKKEIKYENFYSDRDEDQFENDVSDTNASDEPTEPVVTRNKVERVEDETDYESGMESDTSEEIKELRKAVKLKKSLQLQPTTLNKKMATYTKSESIMISALEKKYNCVVRLFTLEEQKREIEERKRYNRAPYCCDYCGKGFHSEIFMIKHLSNHDQSLPHVCDLCGCGFRNRDTYRSHVYSHRESYTCRDCGSVCRDRNSAIKHAESHQGNPHTCPHCGKVIQTTKAFYVHVRMLHPEHSELCNACGKTFFSTRSLRQHITIFHQGINKLEIENNDENVPYQRHCDSCNKTFLTAASFEQHELSEHGKDRKRIIRPIHRPSDLPGFSLVCELCGKAFKSPKQLRTHMKLHRAKKKHQCPHCPKAFRENSLLRNHLRVHTGERPFQCEQCPRTFALRTNLVRHVHIVHLGLEPRTLCPECGKEMCVRSLSLHIQSVHQNIKKDRRVRTGRKRVKKPKTVNDELTINEAIAALMKSEKLTKP